MTLSNDLLFSVLCACLRLSPDSAEAASLIIPAYQEPEVAPRPARERNLIYYSCDPVPSSDLYDTAEIYEAGGGFHKPLFSSLLTFRLLLVCYGPQSLDHALQIRSFLFMDGAGMPRSLLRQAGLYPVPEPAPPAVLREPEGSLWRQRVDLSVLLRGLSEQKWPDNRPSVLTPPKVIFAYKIQR